MPDLLTVFALIAVVLMVSALASGIVERAPLSFPMIFLGLGVLLGERGFGILSVGSHDQGLEAIAILSLSMVLFLDAVRMQRDDLGRDWLAPALILGPGTILIICVVSLAAGLLLGLSLLQSLIVGVILASTDPVVLRDVIRDERIPSSVRRTLSIEAGTNDIVVLPILLVLIALERAEAGSAGEWAILLAQVFLLGPLAGFVVGGLASIVSKRVDSRFEIGRVYQALYGVGVVLAAFVAGEAVGGDGFLAAFAAGVAVVLLDTDLCDCFLEYGEITAEMSMLLAFMLFGALLSTLVGAIPLVPALALAGITIFVARPLALMLVLRRSRMSPRARAFMGWFGPRGLASLLFALLLVRDGVPQAERLLAIIGVVVAVSVVAHGASVAPLAAAYGRAVRWETHAEERTGSASGLFGMEANSAPRVAVDELAAMLDRPNPPVVLDVRSRSQYDREPDQIPGSVRVAPDKVEAWARSRPHGETVVAYCT